MQRSGKTNDFSPLAHRVVKFNWNATKRQQCCFKNFSFIQFPLYYAPSFSFVLRTCALFLIKENDMHNKNEPPLFRNHHPRLLIEWTCAYFSWFWPMWFLGGSSSFCDAALKVHTEHLWIRGCDPGWLLGHLWGENQFTTVLKLPSCCC